ncbi:MAG: ATP-dependent DNA helicase [Candidatus Nanopelagicales bacterium]
MTDGDDGASASEPRDDPDLDRALAAVVDALDGEHRDGQVRMAHAVADALEHRTALLVQAGTGTGKSVAYLVPAVLHSVRADTRVVVATATLALQRQLVERDLPRVVDAVAPLLPRPATYAVLKGRHNYLCRERLEGGPADDEDALFDAGATGPLGRQAVAVRAWADRTDTGDRDDLDTPVDPRVWRAVSVSARECVGRQRCRFGEECFAERARDAAREADVVVTNHALLAIGVLEGIPVLPEHDAVVVDEGHELVDRATQAVTLELTGRLVDRAATSARALVEADVVDLLRDAAEELDAAMRAASEGVRGPQRLDPPGRDLTLALARVRDAGHAALAEVAADRDTSDPDAVARRQRARGALEQVHDTAGRFLALTEHDVAWLDPGEIRATALRLAPLSVAGLLRTALFAQAGVAVTSATLTVGGSFEGTAAALGLTGVDAPAWIGLDVGSPFDHRRQGILYVPTRLPAPGREGVPDAAYDELADLVDAAGGRTLALFSSWRGVDRAAERLEQRFADREDRPLLVQRRGDPVGVLVDRFAADPRATLLGTLSLWQGVDVPGPSCTCVVIDRLPFPRPDDPLLAARQRAVDEAGGSGFRAVSVPRAALMLAQGVGRLIRGPRDRGVVAVLDPRLATAGYGRSIRDTLPPFWFTTDPDVVRAALRRLDGELTAALAGGPVVASPSPSDDTRMQIPE